MDNLSKESGVIGFKIPKLFLAKAIIELRACSSFLLEEILVFDFRSFNI